MNKPRHIRKYAHLVRHSVVDLVEHSRDVRIAPQDQRSVGEFDPIQCGSVLAEQFRVGIHVVQRPEGANLSEGLEMAMKMLKLLRRIGDFENCRANQDEAEYVKQGAQKICISWVPANDATATHINIGGNNFRLERMVYPFTETDEQNSETHNDRMCICDALQFKGHCRNYPGSTKNYEHMIPVFDLQPGQRFIHISNEAVENVYS